MLDTRPRLGVGDLGQSSEFSLTQRASFHVLHKGVLFGGGQRVGQQADEHFVGGTNRHGSASQNVQTGAGATLFRGSGHDAWKSSVGKPWQQSNEVGIKRWLRVSG